MKLELRLSQWCPIMPPNSADFLRRLLLCPVDGGDKFLRIILLSPNYTALQSISTHVILRLVLAKYCHEFMMCDFRRVLDWSDLLNYLIQRVTTFYRSLLHTHTHTHTRARALMSTVTPSLAAAQRLQRWTFPLLWGPELFPFLNYQLLTGTSHKDWTSAVFTHQPTHYTLQTLTDRPHYDIWARTGQKTTFLGSSRVA
jgi:hypothetical protein